MNLGCAGRGCGGALILRGGRAQLAAPLRTEKATAKDQKQKQKNNGNDDGNRECRRKFELECKCKCGGK